jgi:hypothetical protein
MIERELSQLIDNDTRYAALAARFANVTFPGHAEAKRIYSVVFHADFEFYSHFVGRFDCQYQKTPEMVLECIAEGYGGHCIEKNLTLKYLLEQAGFEKVGYVFGGSVKGSHRPFDSEKAEEVGIGSWVSGYALPQTLHCSVLLTVGGKEYIFDPNNGRMGPLITTPRETEQLLRDEHKAHYDMYHGRMYYQRVPHSYHEQILFANRGDDLFGLRMAECLGLLAKDNFDIIVTTIDNATDARQRWHHTPHLREVMIVGDDFGALEKLEAALSGIDTKMALYLQEARQRLNEIGMKEDGYPRYLAVRVFDRTWWEMSRLTTLPVKHS